MGYGDKTLHRIDVVQVKSRSLRYALNEHGEGEIFQAISKYLTRFTDDLLSISEHYEGLENER